MRHQFIACTRILAYKPECALHLDDGPECSMNFVFVAQLVSTSFSCTDYQSSLFSPMTLCIVPMISTSDSALCPPSPHSTSGSASGGLTPAAHDTRGVDA